MTMKLKDVGAATALIIQGYLRSNGEESLFDILSTIRQECFDWAENLTAPAGKDINALEPTDISIDLSIRGAEVPRSPQNLVAAAMSLALEAVDVGGPGVIESMVAKLAAVQS